MKKEDARRQLNTIVRLAIIEYVCNVHWFLPFFFCVFRLSSSLLLLSPIKSIVLVWCECIRALVCLLLYLLYTTFLLRTIFVWPMNIQRNETKKKATRNETNNDQYQISQELSGFCFCVSDIGVFGKPRLIQNCDKKREVSEQRRSQQIYVW